MVEPTPAESQELEEEWEDAVESDVETEALELAAAELDAALNAALEALDSEEETAEEDVVAGWYSGYRSVLALPRIEASYAEHWEASRVRIQRHCSWYNQA